MKVESRGFFKGIPQCIILEFPGQLSNLVFFPLKILLGTNSLCVIIVQIWSNSLALQFEALILPCSVCIMNAIPDVISITKNQQQCHNYLSKSTHNIMNLLATDFDLLSLFL